MLPSPSRLQFLRASPSGRSLTTTSCRPDRSAQQEHRAEQGDDNCRDRGDCLLHLAPALPRPIPFYVTPVCFLDTPGSTRCGLRIGEIESEYLDPNTILVFPFKRSRLLAQNANDIRERELFLAVRVHPVVLSSMIGQ